MRPAQGADTSRAIPGRSLPPPHPPTPSPSRGRGGARGINGAPVVVVEGKSLIPGEQPAGVFEAASRGIDRSKCCGSVIKNRQKNDLPHDFLRAMP